MSIFPGNAPGPATDPPTPGTVPSENPPGPVTVPPSDLTRPFAAPVTSQTIDIANGLNSTQVNDIIDAASDGTTFVFASGGSYAFSAGIRITNCNNLIFDGNGATITMSGVGTNQLTSPFMLGWSYAGAFWTGTASHIEIKDFTLIGVGSPGGTSGQGEEQAGIKSHSATYVEVHDCTIRAMTGDAFQVEVTASNQHWYHDNTIDSCGRNGLTVGGGSNILCENNAFPIVGYFTLDLEPTPGFPTETYGVTFRNNTPCDWSVWGANGGGFFSLDGSHTGDPIDNVVVSGNTVTAASLYTQVNNGGTGRNLNIQFTGNSCANSGTGPVLNFAHVDGLTVTGNTQPLSSGSLVSATDCTSAVTSPNP